VSYRCAYFLHDDDVREAPGGADVAGVVVQFICACGRSRL
jgi:hypothetical protein